MTRLCLSFLLIFLLAACSDDGVPTAFAPEAGSSPATLAKSSRVDGPPIPPLFFNALNPESFVNFREYPEWVPIIFYRDVACTPHDINFLSTAFDLRSVTCASLIDGYLVWSDKNPAAPQVVHERASGPVAMWFVTVDDWFDMAEDEFIGWDELRSAPSFREGFADFYHGRANFIASTSQKDVRGYLTSPPDARFRMTFVGRVEYLDDGSFIEHVAQLNVEFDGV